MESLTSSTFPGRVNESKASSFCHGLRSRLPRRSQRLHCRPLRAAPGSDGRGYVLREDRVGHGRTILDDLCLFLDLSD
ncbi:hypothetical protein G4B88_020167 [Cannabis sativa]|uniref:Uncharacterized protein n=1 Tax=Cannabis sativa TaxID=3483 RepID=A0A7J6E311_CANSA|nr:hypothetical protein G4B88_020167 [Cannabis sativa]